jgi:hypothetical protein
MMKQELLVKMMEYVHGKPGNPARCHYEAEQSDVDNWIVWLVKDGNNCWSVTEQDLLFDYTLKRLPLPELPPQIEPPAPVSCVPIHWSCRPLYNGWLGVTFKPRCTNYTI